jgi:hypothetical protein
MRPTLALPLALALCACRSAYYSTMEQFGVHKRDILVDEVEDGREDQAEAQEQFQNTYEAFRELTGYDGGELEEVYDNLADELEDWQDEIGEMENASLQRESKSMLSDTRARYGELIGAMQRSEEKMEPVLQAFRDHVLFLKHNLNAKAIASLQNIVPEIEDDVAELIADMERSIAEADEFVKAME